MTDVPASKKLPDSLTGILPPKMPTALPEASDEEIAALAKFEAHMRQPSTASKHVTDIAVLQKLPITNRESGAIFDAAMAFIRELNKLMEAPESMGQSPTMRVYVEASATVFAMVAKTMLDQDREALRNCAETGAVSLKVRGIADLSLARALEMVRQAAKENRPIV